MNIFSKCSHVGFMLLLNRRGEKSYLGVALHGGRDAVHQLIDNVDDPIGGDDVRLNQGAFLPAAVETDSGLAILKEVKQI